MSSESKGVAWLDAYRVALGMQWPCKAPTGVTALRNVANSLPFVAPEFLGLHARRAWEVYQEEGDTPVGRAAVALVYCIQDIRDKGTGRPVTC